MHSRQLYCITDGFNAQQKALLHSRRFYCIAGSFTAQQKSQSCGRNQRKVPSATETGEKFILRQKQRISPLCSVFPWTWTQHLRTNWQRQNGTLKPILRSARPDFLLRKRNIKRTFYTDLPSFYGSLPFGARLCLIVGFSSFSLFFCSFLQSCISCHTILLLLM